MVSGDRGSANLNLDRSVAERRAQKQDLDPDPSDTPWQDEPAAQGLAGLAPASPHPAPETAAPADDAPTAPVEPEVTPSSSGEIICEVKVASSDAVLVALREGHRELALRELKELIQREAGPLASDQVLRFGDATLDDLEGQPLKHVPASGPPATLLLSSALAAAEEKDQPLAESKPNGAKDLDLEAEAMDVVSPLSPNDSDGARINHQGSLRETTTDKEGAAEGKRAPRSGGAIGKPFPKRPTMCKLSQKTWDKLEEFFRGMDQDGSNAVTRAEADVFFQGSFKKLSTDAMFNEVDVDGSGAIAADEFMGFWEQVRKAGYSDQDIFDEVEMLCEGGAWVDWKDGRDTSNAAVKFPKRPLFCKLSTKTWKRCEELFRKFDTDGTLSITREKAYAFFTGAFSNISVEAMFNEVDLNNHGAITAQDFMQFWVQVKASGYKEKDILEEIDTIMDGGAWVDWKDGRSTA